MWSGRGHPDISVEVPGGLPFTAAGEKAFEAVYKEYDPTGFCLYPGVTRITMSPYPIEIVQTSDRFAILYEYMNTFRSIPADRRAHPKDPGPTFFGNSSGKWDGDIFTVNVIGFNNRSWLDPAGHPHDENLHLIERYRYLDPDHFRYEATIDDPTIYSRPWNSTILFTRKPDWELTEYSCDENKKDRFC